MINVLPNTVIGMSGHALIEIRLPKTQHHGDRTFGSKPQIPSLMQSCRSKSINATSSDDCQHIG